MRKIRVAKPVSTQFCGQVFRNLIKYAQNDVNQCGFKLRTQYQYMILRGFVQFDLFNHKSIFLAAMAKILIVIAMACALVAFVQCAPQFDQVYQQQPEQQSRFAVLDGTYHQDPNLEYNFE